MLGTGTWDKNVPAITVTPAEIKASVVGYGRADKNQMQQMVKMLLGLDAVPSPHDAADALALAICHVWRGGTKQKLEIALRKAIGQ